MCGLKPLVRAALCYLVETVLTTLPSPLESCDTDCRGADLGSLNPTCVRQSTSAYVSIRQHTSAYVSIRCRSRILKSNLWRWGPMLKIASILSLSGPIITRHVCASSLVRSILQTTSSRNKKTKCANACGPNIL